MNQDSSAFDLDKVPDPCLLKVNFFPTLKRLTLNSMRWVTMELFRHLVSANTMPNLEFIDLRGKYCKCLSARSFELPLSPVVIIVLFYYLLSAGRTTVYP
jgi:hypothetical protein